MTTYAAYSDDAIYALGRTPKEAVENARDEVRDPDADFQVAPISEELAAQIDQDGWNGRIQSFDIRRGWVVETTNE